MRINARLDDESAERVDYLTRMTQGTVTSVLKEAIQHYYAEVRRSELDAGKILMSQGFIGCGEADPELSTDYKDQLTRDLTAKSLS